MCAQEVAAGCALMLHLGGGCMRSCALAVPPAPLPATLIRAFWLPYLPTHAPAPCPPSPLPTVYHDNHE